jgi:hypothetical protein
MVSVALARTAALLLVAFAATSCSGGHQNESANGQCAGGITFEGRTYVGWNAAEGSEVGPRIGTAQMPSGCADGTVGDSEEQVEVAVRRLPGLSPKLVVFTPRDPTSVYIAEGTDRGTWPEALEEVVSGGA